MKRKFKKGAASFYIVAFATLILMILALSFTAVIVSEVTRTSNDDLSQSAYDSAMAGVEDAKLAFYNYQNCKAKGVTSNDAKQPDGVGDLTCEEIVWYVEHGLSDTSNYKSCDMVGHILGRIGESESGQVEVKEGTVVNNMQQAYTCTTLNNSLANYSSYVRNIDVTKLQFDGVAANDIKEVVIRWGSAETKPRFLQKLGTGMLTKDMTMPPTISFAILQTAEDFSLSDFDVTKNGRTDRGMVYLVPFGEGGPKPSSSSSDYYISAYNGSRNFIPETALSKSNDKVKRNVPYMVYCNTNTTSEYACSATIRLPQPVGGNRSDKTFVAVVGNPAMSEDVKYSMEFRCDSAKDCVGMRKINRNEKPSVDKNVAFLENVQLEIDSTGRANDLFRRIVTRYKSNSDYALSIMGPLELLGDDDDDGLEKDFGGGNTGGAVDKNKFVTCEANFITTGSNCD